tara:strand:+ start:530 stop:673 length:144 start_codon:yes stop_codon:yes gene_type:complete
MQFILKVFDFPIVKSIKALAHDPNLGNISVDRIKLLKIKDLLESILA